MFSAVKRAAELFARASVNLLEKLIIGFFKVIRLQFLTLRHAGIASVFGLLIVSTQYSNAAVPREVYYKGSPYTEELSKEFYTIGGYCEAYSAWRAGNPSDNYTFTVQNVIDVDGINIQCWGRLRQKVGAFDVETYIPTTALRNCPRFSRNYVGNDCDCDFGFTERGGRCELQNNDPDSDPPNEPRDPDGPGSSDNPGGPGDASGPGGPGDLGIPILPMVSLALRVMGQAAQMAPADLPARRKTLALAIQARAPLIQSF